MIPSSTINDVSAYAPGWLGRYVEAMGQDVAPLSFHLLAGMLVMSSVVGRRAALVRPTGVLWPPTSILLLAPSGIGKSLSLKTKAMRVARLAFESQAYVSQGNFTTAAIVNDLRRLQAKGLEVLEGLHIEDEASVILTKRTGNETTAQWIIGALEHRDETEEKTVSRGTVILRNLTIAFGLGTTLEYLRQAVSVHEFTGGFMHRFLIAHEADQREGKDVVPSDAIVEDLAKELQEIRQAMPSMLSVAPPVESKLRSLGVQAMRRYFDSIHLQGYWNRYPMLLLKLASLMAMAEHRSRIEMRDLETAQALLDTKLYPVLEGLIEELGASRERKHLIEVADSLRKAGPEGWDQATLIRKLDVPKRNHLDAISTLLAMGSVYRVGGRYYGRRDWAQDNHHQEDDEEGTGDA